jgi:hypothetical protein
MTFKPTHPSQRALNAPYVKPPIRPVGGGTLGAAPRMPSSAGMKFSQVKQGPLTPTSGGPPGTGGGPCKPGDQLQVDSDGNMVCVPAPPQPPPGAGFSKAKPQGPISTGCPVGFGKVVRTNLGEFWALEGRSDGSSSTPFGPGRWYVAPGGTLSGKSAVFMGTEDLKLPWYGSYASDAGVAPLTQSNFGGAFCGSNQHLEWDPLPTCKCDDGFFRDSSGGCSKITALNPRRGIYEANGVAMRIFALSNNLLQGNAALLGNFMGEDCRPLAFATRRLVIQWWGGQYGAGRAPQITVEAGEPLPYSCWVMYQNTYYVAEGYSILDVQPNANGDPKAQPPWLTASTKIPDGWLVRAGEAPTMGKQTTAGGGLVKRQIGRMFGRASAVAGAPSDLGGAPANMSVRFSNNLPGIKFVPGMPANLRVVCPESGPCLTPGGVPMVPVPWPTPWANPSDPLPGYAYDAFMKNGKLVVVARQVIQFLLGGRLEFIRIEPGQVIPSGMIQVSGSVGPNLNPSQTAFGGGAGGGLQAMKRQAGQMFRGGTVTGVDDRVLGTEGHDGAWAPSDLGAAPAGMSVRIAHIPGLLTVPGMPIDVSIICPDSGPCLNPGGAPLVPLSWPTPWAGPSAPIPSYAYDAFMKNGKIVVVARQDIRVLLGGRLVIRYIKSGEILPSSWLQIDGSGGPNLKPSQTAFGGGAGGGLQAMKRQAGQMFRSGTVTGVDDRGGMLGTEGHDGACFPGEGHDSSGRCFSVAVLDSACKIYYPENPDAGPHPGLSFGIAYWDQAAAACTQHQHALGDAPGQFSSVAHWKPTVPGYPMAIAQPAPLTPTYGGTFEPTDPDYNIYAACVKACNEKYPNGAPGLTACTGGAAASSGCGLTFKNILCKRQDAMGVWDVAKQACVHKAPNPCKPGYHLVNGKCVKIGAIGSAPTTPGGGMAAMKRQAGQIFARGTGSYKLPCRAAPLWRCRRPHRPHVQASDDQADRRSSSSAPLQEARSAGGGPRS